MRRSVSSLPSYIFAVVSFMAAAVMTARGQQLSSADMGYDYPRTLSSLVVNPTTDATAMYRYKDCPVSYATGTAEISIPLLECRSADLGIALSLSYHTGGIKVSDEAGSIALGWTLQGLGRISRQVCVMPDESSPFERESTTASVKSQLMYNTEANYDRYSYDFPGYTGVFFITDDSLVHMSNNGVKIERMCSSKNKFATDSFAIVTPEGIRYTFGQREICKREHWIANGSGNYTDISYEAPVVWNLTTIQSLLTSEKITVSYATENYDRHDDIPITLKFGRKWSHESSRDCYLTSIASYSDGVSRFFGHAIPKSISGKTFNISFSFGYAGSRLYVKKISLHNAANTEVRSVELENDGGIIRRQLTGLKITSDKKIVDRRTFTYYNADGAGLGRDFFGYANGSSEYLMSVLDISTLKLNAARRHNETMVKAWSLKSMTDVTGAVTTFSYISKHWTPPAGSLNNILTSVYNGIAVSKIETVDPLTGRWRTRSFSYSEPVMSMPLQFLTTDDFISLSGSKTYEDLHSGDNTYSNYTLTAEFTSSCRRPGFAAENMVIYYDRVTERVSGTGISYAVRTDYEFDNSMCIHILGTPSMHKSPAHVLYSSTEPTPTWAFSMILGQNIPHTQEYIPHYGIPVVGGPDDDKFEKIFKTKNAYSGFTERVDPMPLMSKKISYEYRNGRYEPAETVENFYSSGRHTTLTNGRYVQGNIYKSSFENEYSNSLDRYDAIDVCYVYTQSDFMRLDSTATTRHYPDGNSRRVMTRHSYGSLTDASGKAVSCDTLALNALSPIPHSTLSRFGNEYFITHSVRAEDVASSFYRSATQKGFARIPVFQRWKSGARTSVDSIEIRQDYSSFNGFFPLKSRITLFRGGEKAATQIIKSYDTEANITSMTETDGTNHRYTWLSGYGLLSSSTLSTFNNTFTSSYTWLPLVGCTSITEPSGRKHTFSYSGGRLSEEKDTGGNTVAAYGYSLYADSGHNMTEKTVYGDNCSATTRVYYDGFGLPVQTVAVNASGDASQHVATYVTYDALGRQRCEYRPVPLDDDGAMTSHNDFASLASSFYGGDSRPFTATTYYATAGEKVAAVYSPGDALADHPARTEYLCNSITVAELKVRQYLLSPAADSFIYWIDYPAGSLDAVRSVDPDGHEVIVFSDWRGFKILERRKLSATDFLDTYYINDVWGQPLVVLSPEASAILSVKKKIWKLDTEKTIKDYAFVYRYDRCGRMIYSRIPGCEPVTYRYDRYGRLAFMQDGNMREAGRAMFTIYDGASRIAVTGMCDDDAMKAGAKTPDMSSYFDNSYTYPGICNTGYIENCRPEYLRNAELLTANYYDDYQFLGIGLFGDFPYKFSYISISAKGLPTGSLTAVLSNSDNDIPPIAAITFYDNEDRPVKIVSTTHLPDSWEQTVTTYTLDNRPKTVSHTLTRDSVSCNDSYHYTYDNVGRISEIKALMPSMAGQISLLKKTYNPIGIVSQNNVNGLATSYAYDVGGRLLTMENSLTSQSFEYSYAGKVSTFNNNYDVSRYFTYDNAGRLVNSTSDLTVKNVSSTYTYDLNSNITSLSRFDMFSARPPSTFISSKVVDDLSFKYDGNRLIKVTDVADEVISELYYDFNDGADLSVEYSYDSNGNMTTDLNRGVASVEYNVLNLPSKITFDSERTISNVYTADGRKLSSVADWLSQAAPDGMFTQKDYIGRYELTDGDAIRLYTDYGYCENGIFYNYLRDYQGNIIDIVYKGAGNTYNYCHSNAYYPYGLPTQESSVIITDDHRYGGKEFDLRNGLNVYDFHARTYAPDLCRFWQPDPQAHDYHWFSPYSYCGGDPVNFIDPTGREWHYIKPENEEPYFVWVNPKDAYDGNGNLQPDHYVQAISFSREGPKGKFDVKNDFNIGTATATVYKADGSTEDFDACTNPSDPSKFATIPKGRYEAKVGKHKVNTPNEYMALRMGDVGTTNFYNNIIELGVPNPSNTSTTIAIGINIHMAGRNNFTGITKNKTGVSEGCILIDRNQWNAFIKLFNNSKQKDNIVGIIILR